ncbi:MAG: amidohydrolase, partial [Symploca sp. SIO1B1]|nr:amidohydrolase [Symploca sp. SIO1B1]
SVLTIVDGQMVYAAAEFSNFSPPPLPISPDWSPVKYYGGYHKDSKVSFVSSPQAKATINSSSRQNLHLPSLSMPGSLSRFWGGLACACCF